MNHLRWQRVLDAAVTWHPTDGGAPAFVWWKDDVTVELGEDPSGEKFEQIAELAISGNYYPPEVIVFDGQFRVEGRPLLVGDRILQSLQVGPIGLWSGAEIFLARKTDSECEIGYVTTTVHHGRGIWQARIYREGTKLKLQVRSQAGPQSWAFWIGLPVARYLQKRARTLAIRRFQELVKG